MTSGFSAEVAMAVTHPPWPSRVPLKVSDSDMLTKKVLEEKEGGGASSTVVLRARPFRVSDSARA